MHLRREGGFTVAELAVAMAILLVVVVAAMASMDAATRTEANQQTRAQTHDELRQALDEVTKEVRQALSVATTSTASRLDMQTLIDDVTHHVVYDVAAERLTRAVDGGQAVVLLERLTSTSVFAYDPPTWTTTPDVVKVTLSARTRGPRSTTLTLAGDVRLRNSSS